MGMNGLLNRATAGMSRSWWLGPTAIQYYCAVCGIVCSIMFILAFGVAGFIPPTKPYWDAETIAEYYQDHIVRIRAGAAILMISGGFYLPFSAAISNQMRLIPNLHYMIHQVQLASAAAGCWTFILPGVVLAIASYRPDRPVEITQAMNDFFWIVALMPWPTFIVQNFAFAYAIILDSREKPLFPKSLAIVNIVVPILFTFATGMHTVKSGALAWDGVVTFWIVGFSFCVQLIIDAVCLFTSARREEQSGEMSKEMELENGNNIVADRAFL